MERETKIVLGLIGLTVGVIGVSYLYNVNQKPKIESYDNTNKTITYIFRGSKKTEKLDPLMATKIGRYSIVPILDASKKVMGAEIKDYNGSVVDSMYYTPSEETMDTSTLTASVKNASNDNHSPKQEQDNINTSSSEHVAENSKPIYPIISPPQVGAKEWNNIRKLATLLTKKVGKPNWITRASADENKKFYNNFKSFVTHNEYNTLGKFLATYKDSESKTLASWSVDEKQLLNSGVSKIHA